MGKRVIYQALLRAVVVSVAAVVGSVSLGFLILPLMGNDFDRTALVMCVACPLIIAFPMAFSTYRQNQALANTHEALTQAHAALAVAHARLADKARTDQMTGMLNREAFFDAARDRRTDGRPGMLLIIDADNFKRINDEHGHHIGDIALLEIAGAIRQGARSGDVIGRIGGEEFAVFLPDVTPDEGAVVAERIRHEVENRVPPTGNGQTLRLTVSIGGVVAARSAGFADLMRTADRRLYDAKRLGRNRTVFRDEAVSAAA